MREFIVLLILCLVTSCQKKAEATYFGGKIINPMSDHVVLYKQDKVIDTIPLDSSGYFSCKFNLDTPGLFTFKHDYEFQVLYVEPYDSITLRLNTKEFDKSLVYAGDKAHENNFLIENFLLNQKNSNLIMSYYKIAPDDFENITDSIKNVRQEKLEHLDKNYGLSKTYKNIAQKSIDFEFFDMRERYAFLLKKFFPKKASKISDSFFDYRENLNLNDPDIIDLIGYRRFLDNYLKNMSIETCHKRNWSNCNDLSSIENLDVRIKLVDSLLTNDYIRKRYLDRFIQQEIVNSKNKTQIEHTISHLSKVDLSEQEKSDIELLAKFQESFFVNKNISETALKSPQNNTFKLKDIVNHSHCIVYSWSIYSPNHHKLRLKKIKSIKKYYPNIQLIGINIDYNNPEKWLKVLREHNANIENEYQIIPEEHSKFYRNYLNKILFLDEDCNIKKSETILTNEDFEKHLKHFVGL